MKRTEMNVKQEKKLKTKTKTKTKQKFDDEIEKLQQKYPVIQENEIKRFADFPLSQKTLRGLQEAKFIHPTVIQRQSIGPALQGKDVLGAAITGSGKTLAFLIPVLEHLFINKWTRLDGIGAIIVSPTRELAYQIFETLKKIGKYHDFSAGLIIGGKNLKFERSRMDQCNILICTPGRLLQHMDMNPLFNASTMEILVLDEADRCLDMGFEEALNAIIENFPPQRQTLLFSATQTNSVKDLARLNLKDPVYIGHSKDDPTGNTLAVPDLLAQNYVVVALEDKITMLWSFIKNHLKQKIIVFLTSCKQVKYIYEIFCKLRPGTSLLALYGTLHQDRRIAIYNDFLKKSNVVLFATDVASRGLDFPAVNWVVQLDCPEDVPQYVHRAGRSARNKTRGESLLVLMPTEEEVMIEELNKQFINIQKIQIDPKKLFSPRAKIEGFLAQNTELKASAQRAFLAYIKSIFLMKNKQIFKVFELDFDAYAKSLGLAITPRVQFIERIQMKRKIAAAMAKKNGIVTDADGGTGTEYEFVNEAEIENGEKNNEKQLMASHSDAESDDDDFLTIKRADHEIQNDENDTEVPLPPIPKKEKLVTKAALAKKAIRKKLQINDKRKFDDDGQEIIDKRKQMQATLELNVDDIADEPNGGIDIELSKKLISQEDKYDKQRFRELVKQRHRKQKEKLKKRTANDEERQEDDADADANDDDDDYGENSVDLSWLPDPDKVYDKQSNDNQDDDNSLPSIAMNDSDNDDHDDDEDEDDDGSDEETFEPARKKLKVASKLSLMDAETIAAQLLSAN